MIYFTFRIENPWHDYNLMQKDYICFERQLTKNKALSFQLTEHFCMTFFDLTIDISFRGQSHAGIKLNFGLIGWWFNLELYDIRHWNYKENRWYKYDNGVEE